MKDFSSKIQGLIDSRALLIFEKHIVPLKINALENFLYTLKIKKDLDQLKSEMTTRVRTSNNKLVAITLAQLVLLNLDKDFNLSYLEDPEITKKFGMDYTDNWQKVKIELVNIMALDLIKAGKINQLLALKLVKESIKKVYKTAFEYYGKDDKEEISMADKNIVISQAFEDLTPAEVLELLSNNKGLINYIGTQRSIQEKLNPIIAQIIKDSDFKGIFDKILRNGGLVEYIKNQPTLHKALVDKIQNIDDIVTLAPKDIKTYVESLKSLNLLREILPFARIKDLSSDKFTTFIKVMNNAGTIDMIFSSKSNEDKLRFAELITQAYRGTINIDDRKALEDIYDKHIYNSQSDKTILKGKSTAEVVQYVRTKPPIPDSNSVSLTNDEKMSFAENFKLKDIMAIEEEYNKAMKGNTTFEKIIKFIATVVEKITNRSFASNVSKSDGTNPQLTR